jgi:hypothetical protein
VRRYGLLIFFSVLLLYLSLPTKNYYWDGVSFAQDVEGQTVGPWFLHPNHLLYCPLGRELWLAVNAAGIQVRALPVLQVLSAVTGAATVAVLFGILLEVGASGYVASCLAFAFAFSATWWKFATDADSYVPSTFLLTLTLWLLVRKEHVSPVVPGLVLGGAMLLHQLAALFFPAAILALWIRSSGEAAGRRWENIGVFALAAGIPTVGLYALSFAIWHQSLTLGELMRWVVAHSQDVSFSFSIPRNVWISILGHFRLVLGGNLRLVLEQRSPVSMVAGAALAISLLLLMGRLIQLPPKFPFPISKELRRLLPVLALWWGTYAVFLVFWLPHNTFYRLFYLPGLLMLCVPLLSGVRTKYNRLALGVAAIFLINFGFYIYPQTKPEANPKLQIAEQMRNVWAPGDTVFWDVFNADNRTIQYLNPQVKWRELWGRAWISQIEDSFTQSDRVWFDSAALSEFRRNDPELESWLSAHCRIGNVYEFAFTNHVLGFVPLEQLRPAK